MVVAALVECELLGSSSLRSVKQRELESQPQPAISNREVPSLPTAQEVANALEPSSLSPRVFRASPTSAAHFQTWGLRAEMQRPS